MEHNYRYPDYSSDDSDADLVTYEPETEKEIIKYHIPKIVLIEKPIFGESKSFNFLKKYKKKIFVGYNRTKFDNVIYLNNKL